MVKKLYKSRTNTKLDGVCAGIAKYLEIDVTLVRLVWVFASFFGGFGILTYIICCLVIPREPEMSEYDIIEPSNRN